jgi:hypothetical protein
MEAGNLKSSSQQTVKVEQGGAASDGTTTTIIRIEPAQPQVVYVPVYSPTVVYGTWAYPAYPPPPVYPPGYVMGATAISFSIGFAIGSSYWRYPPWSRRGRGSGSSGWTWWPWRGRRPRLSGWPRRPWRGRRPWLSRNPTADGGNTALGTGGRRRTTAHRGHDAVRSERSGTASVAEHPERSARVRRR